MATLAEQLFKIPKLLAKFKTLEHTGARLFDVGVLIQTQTHVHTHTHTQVSQANFIYELVMCSVGYVQ